MVTDCAAWPLLSVSGAADISLYRDRCLIWRATWRLRAGQIPLGSTRPQPGTPRMIRVDQTERRVQPAAFRPGQQRQHTGEVSLVLVPRVLCLEQQHGLDCQVRDPVVCTPDDLAVRPADPLLVAAADPDVSVVRLAEDIEAPPACRRVPGPGLM